MNHRNRLCLSQRLLVLLAALLMFVKPCFAQTPVQQQKPRILDPYVFTDTPARLALPGEANVDGKLDEWEGHEWAPVGLACQARSRAKPEDYRKSPEEFFTRWAFKVGERGLYLAARITGDPTRDNFTVFFDPRSPKELGTVGRYYWIGSWGSGSIFADGGQLRVAAGETSPKPAPKPQGAWRTDEDGATLEIFVPYALMERQAWPESGDLGLSIVWTHHHEDDRITRLTWSEDAHEWNPRWYGVVRRVQPGATGGELPYMVRIK